MQFNPRETEAKISLGTLQTEDFPTLAWDALEAGYDGPAICSMAAFQNPTWFEIDEILAAFMRETGMKPITKPEAAKLIAYETVREIVDGRKAPFPFLPVFYQLWIASGQSRELQEIENLDDAASWLSVSEHKAYIHDGLILFARDYENPESIAPASGSS